jgi:ATP-binding cassette subfamily B protein
VLRNCSVRIGRREQLLLQGESGGGKSTLLAVLSGQRRPSSGVVLMNGLDRASLGAASWRKHLVVAPQFHDNHLFNASFAFNVLMGTRWPASAELGAQAEAVCRELGLGGLIDRMPAGMAQQLGENGWQLSHGEKSRLFIARALIQDAPLLVLDESFAALDPDNTLRALQCVRARARALLVVAHP